MPILNGIQVRKKQKKNLMDKLIICVFFVPESFQAGLDLNLQDLMEDQKDEFDRYQNILTDLMYLLRVPLEAERFSDQFRSSFSKGVESFLHLLSYLQVSTSIVVQLDNVFVGSMIKFLPCLQFSDPHKRQTGHHVEYESGEWEYVGKMIASLASITLMIHKWCARDKGTLIAVTKSVK